MDTASVHGVDVPVLGMGTARMEGRACRDAVGRALEAGYRHVDTAQMYDNEAAVGAAIAGSAVPREAVFVTTKLDRGNLRAARVRRSVGESLDRLGTDYVDLLLIHAPSRSVPVAETLGAMADLVDEGAVGAIGVSNFSVEQTREAVAAADVPLVTNQVKYHPYHEQGDLLAFCVEHDLLLTAHTPLANGRVADDEVLAEIGARHGKTAAQVALRWLIQQPNVIAIPKAADPDHLAENAAVFDFALTDAEMARVFEHQGGLRDRVRDLLGR